MSDTCKIGSFAKVRRGASPRPIGDTKYFGGKVGWIRISDVTASRKYLRKTEQYVSPLGESLSVRVDKGDLIMSICGTIGRPIIIDFPSCIHDGFVQLYDIKNSDIEYLYYILQYHEKDFEGKGQPGTQVNLNTGIVENFEIYYPSLPDQLQIARILSTCDAVIEKTQATIAKYKAIKQGMLHDLFTRGIDINTGKLRPKYEDSPELYKESKLGMVPREWKTKVFDELIRTIDSGWSPNCLVEPANIGEWGSLKTTSITWNGYNPNENKKLPLRIIPRIDTEVDFDDILITRVGPRERVGVVVHVNDGRKKLMVSDNMLRFKMKKDENLFLPFLALLLGSQHVQHEWQKRIAGLAEAQVVINQQIIKKTFVVLPEHKEQRAIYEKLDNIMAKLQSEQNYLQKLQSIKQGLMGDLLSGRKRVNVKE